MSCLFCKIIHQEIPATIIFENDQVLAFNDINPEAPHHIIIIPKTHISTINDLEQNDALLVGTMILAAKQIAKSKDLADDGYRLLFNCNAAGGQTVFHIHLHLLGGRQLSWPPG